MAEDWSWLAQTYWYVPQPGLPAPRFDPRGGAPVWMVDQTVWQIEACEQDYIWGNAATLLYPRDTPEDEPRILARRLAGTLTRAGSVQIAFMPLERTGAAQATVGSGQCRQHDGVWAFEMQMATGATELLVHRAAMLQCRPGEAAWVQLPGTTYGVEGLLDAAGFAST